MVWSGRYEEFPDRSDGWTAHAPLLAEIDVEVAFIIKDALYFGPENELTEESGRRFFDPIYQPVLPLRAQSRVFSADALRQPGELVKYYQDVARLAGEHGVRLRPGDPYFWLRSVILERGEQLVSLAWSDTFEESFSFLSRIRAEADGQLYWNMDQGWHMEVIGRGRDAFIRAGDPHYKREFRAFKAPRDVLIERASAAESRARQIKPILLDAIGTNYWDYSPRPAGGTRSKG